LTYPHFQQQLFEENTMDQFTAVGIAEGWIPVDTAEDRLKAWQQLIDTGMCWQLQGWFGRTAMDLIERGLCRPALDD
jgi:hypothetical protein